MPVLIVQGEHDNYFPVHHGEALFEAAQVDSHRAEYWFEPETGHAESAITFELATRMKSWIAHHIRSSR
jgi:fermentation-respiration switch protein FrsA (DUF1100 family)